MMDAALLQKRADAYRAAPSKEALEAAAEACLPLCAAVARRFAGRGEDAEDLRQVAALACVKALRGYDPGKGVSFAAYAAQSAAGAVRNHLRDYARAVRVPRSLYEQTALLTRERENLTRSLGREPTVSELSAALHWDTQRTVETLISREAGDIASLDAEAGEDGRALGETLGGEDTRFSAFESREDIHSAMQALSQRERELLSLRFDEGLSQRAAALRLGMTQMQVLRAEKRALALLRGRIGAS